MNPVVDVLLERFELALWALAKRLQGARRRRRPGEWNDVDIAEVNAEMGDSVIAEIGETLAVIGCCHGHDVKNTPPMFYPEMISCAIKHHVDKARGVTSEGRQEQKGSV